jgi:hypothetical protein
MFVSPLRDGRGRSVTSGSPHLNRHSGNTTPQSPRCQGRFISEGWIALKRPLLGSFFRAFEWAIQGFQPLHVGGILIPHRAPREEPRLGGFHDAEAVVASSCLLRPCDHGIRPRGG